MDGESWNPNVLRIWVLADRVGEGGMIDGISLCPVWLILVVVLVVIISKTCKGEEDERYSFIFIFSCSETDLLPWYRVNLRAWLPYFSWPPRPDNSHLGPERSLWIQRYQSHGKAESKWLREEIYLVPVVDHVHSRMLQEGRLG